MKKTLYSTTALAAAGLLAVSSGDAFAQAAAPAAAQKLQVQLGGFFIAMAGYASQDKGFEQGGASNPASGTALTNYDSFDVKTDSEIYFTGSVKLDSGLTVSLEVQMETDVSTSGSSTTSGNGSASLDLSYVKLTGGFGEARLGSTPFETFFNTATAPSNWFINNENGDEGRWVIKPAAIQSGNGVYPGPAPTLAGDDTMKIGYMTPKFAGFTWSVDYEPNGTNALTMPQVGGTAGTDKSQFATGVMFNDKIADFDVKASVGYDRTTGTQDNSLNSYMAGLQVGFGDLKIGGGYRANRNTDDGEQTSTANPQGYIYDIGAVYAPAGWSIGADWTHSDSPRDAANPNDEKIDKVAVTGVYNIGPGVDTGVQVFWNDYQDDSSLPGNSNSGVGVVGALKLSF